MVQGVAVVIHRSYKNVGSDRSNDIALVLLDRPSSKPVIQLPAGGQNLTAFLSRHLPCRRPY